MPLHFFDWFLLCIRGLFDSEPRDLESNHITIGKPPVSQLRHSLFHVSYRHQRSVFDTVPHSGPDSSDNVQIRGLGWPVQDILYDFLIALSVDIPVNMYEINRSVIANAAKKHPLSRLLWRLLLDIGCKTVFLFSQPNLECDMNKSNSEKARSTQMETRGKNTQMNSRTVFVGHVETSE